MLFEINSERDVKTRIWRIMREASVMTSRFGQLGRQCWVNMRAMGSSVDFSGFSASR
jgi:hypothetical protein